MSPIISIESEIQKNLLPFFNELKAGDIILLSGSIGAGKTTFVRKYVEFMSSNEANSPSYNLIQEYPLKEFKVVHIDLYRIESEDELESIGFWEALQQKNCVTFIEWPEKVNMKELPQKQLKSITITLLNSGNNSRLYEFKTLNTI